MYKQIKNKEDYDKLLNSGMFWEFHPELSGDWNKDKNLILDVDTKQEGSELFTFIYVTEDDIKNEYKHIAETLTEDQKTEFSFNEETLYYIGSWHSFHMGFFKEYITKSGIAAIEYGNNRWHICGNYYDYLNDKFIMRITPERSKHTNHFNNTLPIKNVSTSCKTIAEDLVSIYPLLDNNR